MSIQNLTPAEIFALATDIRRAGHLRLGESSILDIGKGPVLRGGLIRYVYELTGSFRISDDWAEELTHLYAGLTGLQVSDELRQYCRRFLDSTLYVTRDLRVKTVRDLEYHDEVVSGPFYSVEEAEAALRLLTPRNLDRHRDLVSRMNGYANRGLWAEEVEEVLIAPPVQSPVDGGRHQAFVRRWKNAQPVELAGGRYAPSIIRDLLNAAARERHPERFEVRDGTWKTLRRHTERLVPAGLADPLEPYSSILASVKLTRQGWLVLDALHENAREHMPQDPDFPQVLVGLSHHGFVTRHIVGEGSSAKTSTPAYYWADGENCAGFYGWVRDPFLEGSWELEILGLD